MEAARAWGVPHSVLMGRCPRPGQPPWTALDTVYAVELQMLERSACNGCGQDRSVSMDPASEGRWAVELLRCHACAARESAVRRFTDAGGDGAGLLLAVQPPDLGVVDD